MRKKVLDILIRRGYSPWYPPTSRSVYIKEKDIHGAFDIEALHKTEPKILWIQLTTVPNDATRLKKVLQVLKDKGITNPPLRLMLGDLGIRQNGAAISRDAYS